MMSLLPVSISAGITPADRYASLQLVQGFAPIPPYVCKTVIAIQRTGSRRQAELVQRERSEAHVDPVAALVEGSRRGDAGGQLRLLDRLAPASPLKYCATNPGSTVNCCSTLPGNRTCWSGCCWSGSACPPQRSYSSARFPAAPCPAPPGRNTPPVDLAATLGTRPKVAGHGSVVDRPVERAVMPHDVVRQHRIGVRHLVAAGRLRSCCTAALLWARDTMPAGCGDDWLGLPGWKRRPSRARAVVVGHGVAGDARFHRVLQRDAATSRSRHVVHHLVVASASTGTSLRRARRPAHVQAVDELGADAAAVARAGLVALHQVGRHRHVAAYRARTRRGRRSQRSLAADEDAAAGDVLRAG